MTQVMTTEPVREHDASPPASLVVLVAPTSQERSALLAQLDPAAPVLVVPSLDHAQELLDPGPDAPTEAAGGQEPAPTGSGRGTPEGQETGSEPDPSARLHLHEDRRAVGFGTVEVTLTRLEFALLRRLIREPGRVWRFDELVREVWGTDHLGDASQVHAVVKRLRAKLAREQAPVVIEAVRGVGFRAIPPKARPA